MYRVVWGESMRDTLLEEGVIRHLSRKGCSCGREAAVKIVRYGKCHNGMAVLMINTSVREGVRCGTL